MANNKTEKEKLPEPTFIDQANNFIDKKFEDAKLIQDPKFGPGLSIFDHKVLAGVMDLQVNHVNDILIERYTEKIAEFYKPIMEAVERIEIKQKSIASDIAEIKLEQEHEKRKLAEHDAWMERKKKRLDELSLEVAKQKQIMERLQPEEIGKIYDELIESKHIFIDAQSTFIEAQHTFLEAQNTFAEAKPVLEWIKKNFTEKRIIWYIVIIMGVWFFAHWVITELMK